MSCEDIRTVLSGFDVCDETTEGARLTTHCLYPSFEPVRVYVVKVGDGYKVHDGRGAFWSAWVHGRDPAAISRFLNLESRRFRLSLSGEALIADVPSKDWLVSAILSVANASASAANSAVSKFNAATERKLAERISGVLSERFGPNGFRREVQVTGTSGGKRHFDFAVHVPNGRDLLINAVAPHHGSVSSKYVAFADTDAEPSQKFAVFDEKLSTDDIALLQQVARIVPVDALAKSSERILR